MISQHMREQNWSELDRPWDLVVVGGGITGAGILREAARLRLRVLLVEQHDFAWGTSSRSSKLIHGGLRYLRDGRLKLVYESVRERDWLVQAAPGLIDPVGFLLATYKGDLPGRRAYSAALALYDLLAGRWQHSFFAAPDFTLLAPYIAQMGLVGGFVYGDAQTDDARLVLRLIREALADGATAINYVRAEGLLRSGGRVTGVRLRDCLSGQVVEVYARVVINATGAWADDLREDMARAARVRPLRGSHLVVPTWRLPVAQAVSFLHPSDRRPVFLVPWEGTTLIGTTDLDHDRPLDEEPRISADEVSYLLAAVEARFPALQLTPDDVLSTYAGVRPVIASGKKHPSRESRDHAIWDEGGLVTVTGGKLTTFRLIALDTLAVARRYLLDMPPLKRTASVLAPAPRDLPSKIPLDAVLRRRLLGRYGADALHVIDLAAPEELEPVPGTATLWAELRWAARAESVAHLEDLLLRRTRIGLVLPEGGLATRGPGSLAERVRAICSEELGWDGARWEQEESAYRQLWRSCYSLPDIGACSA